MSHISTASTVYNDEDSIEAAAAELGLEIRHNQKTYRTYSGNLDSCDFAMVDPNNDKAYECGFVKNADGEYELKYDSWSNGHGMMDKIGENAVRFEVEYKHHRTVRSLRKQGHRVSVRRENGKRRIIAQVRR